MAHKVKIPKQTLYELKAETTNAEESKVIGDEPIKPLHERLFKPLIIISALSNIFVVIYLLFFQKPLLFILYPIFGEQTYDMIYYHALLHGILSIILLFIAKKQKRFYGIWTVSLFAIILSLVSSYYVYDQFLLRPITNKGYDLMLINVVISVIVIIYLLVAYKDLYEPLPRSRKELFKKRAFAIIITFFIITSIIFAWYAFIRPITVNELLYRSFDPGDEVTVAGHITEIEHLNISYGNYKLIKLDDYGGDTMFYRLLVDAEEEHSIGDYFSTKVKFYEYEFNGIKYTTSPTFYYSYGLISNMEMLMDAISFVSGFKLNFIKNNEDGTCEYEVFTAGNDQYPLNQLNLSLRKSVGYNNITSWDQLPYSPMTGMDEFQILESYNHYNWHILFGIEYSMVIGNFNDIYHETIDTMDSLDEGTSANGIVRFVDVNDNNLIDDYDLFILNLPQTEDDYSFESYWMQIGSDDYHNSIASSSKYIINGGNGVLKEFADEEHVGISLKYLSHETVNNKVSTSFEVHRTEYENMLPYSNYTLDLSSEETDFYRWRLGDPTFIQENVSAEYSDINSNGFLDKGDRFIINGFNRDIYAYFTLLHDMGDSIGSIKWVNGYGYINGNFPEIELNNARLVSPNTYRVDLTVPFSHPELRLNDNVYISFYKESSYAENKSLLIAGNIVSRAGVNVSYADYDNDFIISDSDYLLITTDYSGELTIAFFHFDKRLNYMPSIELDNN